tara:strand:+ start:1525 stop:1713 length:189 start_codon:yes stop_codon:yes gene_type:complete
MEEMIRTCATILLIMVDEAKKHEIYRFASEFRFIFYPSLISKLCFFPYRACSRQGPTALAGK